MCLGCYQNRVTGNAKKTLHHLEKLREELPKLKDYTAYMTSKDKEASIEMADDLASRVRNMEQELRTLLQEFSDETELNIRL